MADPVAAAAPSNAPEPAVPPPAPVAPSVAEIRKLKLKLADREVELPEDQVLEIATQNSKAMYEAKKAERDYEEHRAKLKTHWKEVLKEQGIDAKELILQEFAQELEAQADEETLSPDARELKALKAQLAKKEEAEKASTAEQEKATAEAKKEEAKGRLKATVEEAIKVGNLSNSNFVRGLILEKLRFNASNGLPIHPTVLAAEVRETLGENFQDWLRGLSVEQVWAASEKFPEFRKEFVKRFAALKGAKPAPKAPPKPENKTDAKPQRRSAIEEARRLNEAFKRGVG